MKRRNRLLPFITPEHEEALLEVTRQHWSGLPEPLRDCITRVLTAPSKAARNEALLDIRCGFFGGTFGVHDDVRLSWGCLARGTRNITDYLCVPESSLYWIKHAKEYYSTTTPSAS